MGRRGFLLRGHEQKCTRSGDRLRALASDTTPSPPRRAKTDSRVPQSDAILRVQHEPSTCSPRTKAIPSTAAAACYNRTTMKVVHGRVEHGHVVVDEPLPEGTEVTVVVAAAGDESFDLDEEQIAALRESIVQADRGELVPLDEVLNGR